MGYTAGVDAEADSPRGRVAMADVTIRMRPNGPIVVDGPFRLIDSAGNEFTIDSTKPAVALCRCGQSSRRPFCDGTHKTCGFASDERAAAPGS
jgi:CDGSH-type Zn-finger protein